ncbi:MAG: FlgD immunoglobulin-like domain containing protein [Candidatus Eisenbacteria bacterium]
MKQALFVAVVAVLVSLALVPQASAVIHNTTIYQVQQGFIPLADTVVVDSVVVTALDLRSTTYGFLAEERGRGPFSGILVYMGYQRPDTIGGVGVVPGDLVRVQGRYSEYTAGNGTVSEIDYPTIQIIQKGYGELLPELMSVKALGDSLPDSTFCERWEGVFIEVDTVKVVAHLAFNEWHVVEAHNHPGPHADAVLRIGDKLPVATLPRPAVGDTLVWIKGGFSFEFSTYRMWPRDGADISYLGLPPGPNLVLAYPISNTAIDVIFDRGLQKTSAENTNNYALNSSTNIASALLDGSLDTKVHLTTAAQPVSQLDVLTACSINSSFGVPMDSCESRSFRAGLTPISFVQTPSTGDTSQCAGQQVTITGIVSNNSTAFGGDYFVQDRSGGPWHGIYVYQSSSTMLAGDSVVVSGIASEYYNMTEMTSIDHQQRIPIAAPVKATTVSPAAIVAGSPTVESYESVVVKLDHVNVYQIFDTHREWKVGTGTDSVWVGHKNFPYTYLACVGSVVSVTAPLDFTYGLFKIQPRSDADIVVHSAPTAGTPKSGAFALNLFQNTPNPFGSETAIRFTIPSKMSVNLSIFDVTGRLVRSVDNRELPAGEYSASWDGNDAFGSKVGAGVYFVRLATARNTIEKKMVLVK